MIISYCQKQSWAFLPLPICWALPWRLSGIGFVNILVFALYLLLSQDKTAAAVRKQELCSYSSYSDVQCPLQETTNCCFRLLSFWLLPSFTTYIWSTLSFPLLGYSVEVCQMFLTRTTETKGKQRTIKWWTGIEREETTLSSSPDLFCKFFYELLSGLSSTTFSVPHSQDTLLEVNCDEERGHSVKM